MQLDGLADLVVFVAAEQAALFRLEQPVPLKEHGVDGVVILPRQLRRDGQDLAVRLRFLGRLFLAFAAEELVEAELQRVGQQRQKLQVGAADVALPLRYGLIADAEPVRQRLLCQPFFLTAAQNARAHCQFFQLCILLCCIIIVK